MMLMCKHALLPRQPPFHDLIIGIARVSFYKTFWCRFLGKACFLSGDCTRAEASYREALGLQKDALPAWKGLAELYGSTGSTAADARETFEQLVRFLPEAMAMLDSAAADCSGLSTHTNKTRCCIAAGALFRERGQARCLQGVPGQMLHC